MSKQFDDHTLSVYRVEINSALETFFSDTVPNLKLHLSDESQRAVEIMREYTLRSAKRIRGSLGAASYDFMTKRQYAPEGIALGVALELIQSYLLIVDDVMDQSRLRRGKPTVQELYLQDAFHRSTHEANMQAVNVGLVAQHFANIALINSGAPYEYIAQTLHIMHSNIAMTGFGQIDDLYQQVGRFVSEEEILKKYRNKSSYYTFINPLQSGLALAGKLSDYSKEEIELFGEAAGIAFQLHDDYLGIFADNDELGKINTDDLQEAKYTVLVWHVLKHGTADQIETLTSFLGKESLSQTDLGRARAIFDEAGASIYATSKARQYADQAIAVLDTTKVWDSTFSNFLHNLVEFSICRTS